MRFSNNLRLVWLLFLPIQVFGWGRQEVPNQGVLSYEEIPGLLIKLNRSGIVGIQEGNVFTPSPVGVRPGWMMGSSQVLASPEEMAFSGNPPKDGIMFWNPSTNTTRVWPEYAYVSTSFLDETGRIFYIFYQKFPKLGYWEGDTFVVDNFAPDFWRDYRRAYPEGFNASADLDYKQVVIDGHGDTSLHFFHRFSTGKILLEWRDVIYLWDRSAGTVKIILSLNNTERRYRPFSSLYDGPEGTFFFYNQKIYQFNWGTEAVEEIKDYSDWSEKYRNNVTRIDFKTSTEYLVYCYNAAPYDLTTRSYWVENENIYLVVPSASLSNLVNNYVHFRKDEP